MNHDVNELIKTNKRITYNLPFESFDALFESGKSKIALVYLNLESGTCTNYSYNDLNEITLEIASYLKNNLKPTDSIAYSFINTPETIFLNYAAWRAGFTTVPLDLKRDTLERKVYKLELTKSKIFFTRNDKNTRIENIKIRKKLPQLQIVETDNTDDFLKRAKIVPTETFDSPISAYKTCLVLFTSGTTAKPKGVELSLNNLFSNAESILDWLQIKKQDRFLITLPLHHINSVTFTNTVLLAKGTIILSSTYSKSRYWKMMADNKVTVSSIVPTILYDLVNESQKFDKYRKKLMQLSRIQIGSAPVQPTLVKTFIKNFKIPLYQGYGQTETALRSTGVPMNLSPDTYQKTIKSNSLGAELKYTNVEVLNTKGRITNENEIGEICIRGPIIMNGYLNSAKETNASFKHEWFHSGDTGYWKLVQNRKFFFLVGRTKEIIKKAGTLISPLAIENALLDQYSDLESVYAVGFPDERLGQEIGIIVVTKNPDIARKIMDDSNNDKIKDLAQYEYPRACIVVDESNLPTTSTGKVQRTKLKSRFSSSLLESHNTIATTKTHTFRKIVYTETEVLIQALTINNSVWGENMHSSLKEFIKRAKNGLVIGVFDRNEKLQGTVCAIRTNESDLQRIGFKNHWTNTWNTLTGNGTLSTNNHLGDSLVCPAISAKNTSSNNKYKENPVAKINKTAIQKYIDSNKDYVLRFHRKPKAGMKKGGEVVKIIPNGRPEDSSSLGYNVLIKYPKLDINKKAPQITENSSIGTQLIEAVLVYAFKNKIANIYAYSRPAELSKHFKE